MALHPFDQHPRPWHTEKGANSRGEEFWEIFDDNGNTVFYAKCYDTSKATVDLILKATNTYDDEQGW